MTNPQGPPPGHDPSTWTRPSGQDLTGDTVPARLSYPQTPSESPTQQLPVGDPPQEPTTSRTLPQLQSDPPGHPTAPPTGQSPPPDASTPLKRAVQLLHDPLSIVLALVIVVLLVFAGAIGAELIARHIADSKVARATECVVEDNVSVSFGMVPPFLWQHVTGHYTNISIKTAGNQIKQAKKMQADLKISDVRLHNTADSGGTIGALDAAITWPSEGIKETIQDMIPLLGDLVTDVTTNPSDGTVELTGVLGLGGVTVKPKVIGNGLSLQVISLTGLGSLTLPKEAVQPALDVFSSQLTRLYPLGIHVDSVQVTDTGVEGHFSTRNANIPPHDQDPCFANL